MTSLSKWQLMKNFILSTLLSCTLVAVSVYFHANEPIKIIRENILLILIALFAITMPAIGSLCAKVIELKKTYHDITLLSVEEMNKALYEQTLPIFITPFLMTAYNYIQCNTANFWYLSAIDVIFVLFLFHSIFIILDIFKGFVIIAEIVSNILDNGHTDA